MDIVTKMMSSKELARVFKRLVSWTKKGFDKRCKLIDELKLHVNTVHNQHSVNKTVADYNMAVKNLTKG